MSSDAPHPLLSVIIPTRNTRQLTLDCLASVFESETGKEQIECILVDDASRDGTDEAVRQRFPSVRILRNDQVQGFTVSVNRGLAEAHGHHRLLLNSDTEVDDQAIERLCRAFEQQPDLGIAGAALRYPDGSAQWSGGSRPSAAWVLALASGLPALLGKVPGYRKLRPPRGTGPQNKRTDWVTGAAMMIRQPVWQALGPLDERYEFYCQDLDYCLQAQQQGWNVGVVADAIVHHHHGATIGSRSETPEQTEIGAEDATQPAAPVGLDGMNPEILWQDLVRLAAKFNGRSSARRTARLLRFGTRLRLAGRFLRRLGLKPSQHTAWDRRSADFRRSLDRLSQAEKAALETPPKA